MAAITNKRKVLTIKGKAEVIQQIENGTRKADLFREFCVINSAIERGVKPEPRLLVHLNRKDREHKDIVSLNKVTSMRRCLNGCSESEVTMDSELSTVTSLPDSSLV
jgi:hypothetical protein